MNTLSTSMLLQIQALRQYAVKQWLWPHVSTIKMLPEWKVIRNLSKSYQEKLFEFLLAGDVQNWKLEGVNTSVIIKLRINPTDALVKMSELLDRETSEDEVEIDWLSDLPWESMLSAFWDRMKDWNNQNLTFAEWLTSEQTVYLARVPWHSDAQNSKQQQVSKLSNSLFGVFV